MCIEQRDMHIEQWDMCIEPRDMCIEQGTRVENNENYV